MGRQMCYNKGTTQAMPAGAVNLRERNLFPLLGVPAEPHAIGVPAEAVHYGISVDRYEAVGQTVGMSTKRMCSLT